MICEHVYIRDCKLETKTIKQVCCKEKGFGIFIDDDVTLEKGAEILCKKCEMKI